MVVNNKIKAEKDDLLFNIANYTILTVVLAATLFPLLFVLAASFSNPNEVYLGNVWLIPKGFTLGGYKKIFDNSKIWLGYKNTVIYTFIGTLINLFFTLSAAYPLSRKDFMLGKPLIKLYTFTMFFSGGLIPSYLIVKSLGMVNTMWAMVIPSAISTWNMIITRTYFQTNIPEELLESSQLDGCGNVRFFINIALPLSLPIIAVISLFYAVGHWNSYFYALIYLTKPALQPLQIILRDILIQSDIEKSLTSGDIGGVAEARKNAEAIKYGVIIVASAPVLMVYPFVQKYFIKGILVGSVKG